MRTWVSQLLTRYPRTAHRTSEVIDVKQRSEAAVANESVSSPESVERFFDRYGDDPLVFRVLTRFSGAHHALSCGSDIAVPLGKQEAQIRRAVLSLVLEGFVTARRHEGETSYIFTTDPGARSTAGILLRRAAERGLCR